MPRAPSALYVHCPGCDGETLHTVLKGEVGTRGDYTLDAVVRCRSCETTHHVTIREPGDREVPVVVSRGPRSRRVRTTLPRDEVLEVGTELVVDGRTVRVTGLEAPDGRRHDHLTVEDVGTVWAKDHEQVVLRYSINMGRKTIGKEREVAPDETVVVGDEHIFGRLRVRVHALKTTGGRLRLPGDRAEAQEIVRVYAKPTPTGPGEDDEGT